MLVLFLLGESQRRTEVLLDVAIGADCCAALRR